MCVCVCVEQTQKKEGKGSVQRERKKTKNNSIKQARKYFFSSFSFFFAVLLPDDMDESFARFGIRAWNKGGAGLEDKAVIRRQLTVLEFCQVIIIQSDKKRAFWLKSMTIRFNRPIKHFPTFNVFTRQVASVLLSFFGNTFVQLFLVTIDLRRREKKRTTSPDWLGENRSRSIECQVTVEYVRRRLTGRGLFLFSLCR